IDVAFIGIGQNGHIAFNDPPANFEIKDPYIIVFLDETCRNQQVDEGWFKSIEDVPKKAITMSIQEILRAKNIICICPDERKAEAVRNCLSDDIKITPIYPASILKTHKNVFCYLDKFSSSLL
ncbi:MAG: glucosamine-6-phosphate deaminase, partial [Promethearchaeota archaeon]